MADLRSKLQLVLERVEDFLKKGIGESTEETEKRLATLREMSEILAGIIAEKGQVQEEAFEGNQCIVLIVRLNEILLFGLYIECLTQLSNRSNMVNEMENKQKEDKSSALPEFMQVKYDQVKSYLEKAEGQLKKIDETLSELLPKVKEAKINKFEIPDKEIAALETDKEDIENELQTCKKYLDSAEEMLSKLKEDITSETWKFGVKVVGASAGVAAVVAVGGARFATNEIAKICQSLGRGGSVAVGALAGVALLIGLWSIIDRYKTSYRNYVDPLKVKLHGLQTEYGIMEETFKTRVTDRMNAKN